MRRSELLLLFFWFCLDFLEVFLGLVMLTEFLCSGLEQNNQIVSEQGVRKVLYQKVRLKPSSSLTILQMLTNLPFSLVDPRCVP